MYEELVKRLRNCASSTVEDCDGCPYTGGYNGTYCMNGLVTEAADAIEELTKALERSKEYEAFWEKEANEALKKFQVAVANKPRWIPVTERLPENGIRVLCKCRANIYEVLRWREKHDEWYHDVNHIYMSGFVTHWMPLQKPPREEENDEI